VRTGRTGPDLTAVVTGAYLVIEPVTKQAHAWFATPACPRQRRQTPTFTGGWLITP